MKKFSKEDIEFQFYKDLYAFHQNYAEVSKSDEYWQSMYTDIGFMHEKYKDYKYLINMFKELIHHFERVANNVSD